MRPDDTAIEVALKDLALERGRGGTFCPSEVAQALSPDWQAILPDVRRVARNLQAEGWLVATQHGVPVDALSAPGPIRLGMP